jgi:MYXO-CTERM domain-containing protein
VGEALAFHGQGLNERNGTLYLATDNIIDLVALASSDDGRTWKTRLRLEEISGIKSCVQATCEQSCEYLAGIKTFPPQICDARDAGAPDGGAKDASGDGQGGGGGGGCACAAAGRGPEAGAWSLLVLGGAGWRRRRRARRN